MQTLLRSTALALGALRLACDAPTAPAPSIRGSPALDRSGDASSACYAVSYQTASWFDQAAGTVVGVVSGDLVGTIVVTFDPSTRKATGKTAVVDGTIRYDVTGGVLPAPLTFSGTLVQRNIVAVSPSSPEMVSEQHTTTRATTGVRTANLTMHGSFDATVGIAYHQHHGVICP